MGLHCNAHYSMDFRHGSSVDAQIVKTPPWFGHSSGTCRVCFSSARFICYCERVQRCRRQYLHAQSALGFLWCFQIIQLMTLHVHVLGLLWASLVALSKLSDGVIIVADLVSE